MVQIERDFGMLITGTEIPPEYNPNSGIWLANLIRGVLPAAVGSATLSDYYWTVHPFAAGYVHIGHRTTTGATFRFGTTALLAPAGTLTAPYGGVSVATYNMYNPTNPATQQPTSPMHYLIAMNTTELFCQILVESHIAGHREGDDRFSSTYADLIGFVYITPYEIFVAADERPSPSRTIWKSTTATGTIASGETPEGVIDLNAFTAGPDTLVGPYVGSAYLPSVPYAIAAPTIYADFGEPCIGVSTLQQKVHERYNPDVKQAGFWQDAPYNRLYDPSRPDLAFVPVPTSLSASVQSMYVIAVPRDPFVGEQEIFSFASSAEESDVTTTEGEVVADPTSTGLIETTMTASMQTLSATCSAETTLTAYADHHDIFSRYTWAHAFDALDLGHPWTNSGSGAGGTLEATEEWSTAQSTDSLGVGIGARVDSAVRTAATGMTPYIGTNAYLGGTFMSTLLPGGGEAFTLRTLAKFENGTDEGGVFFGVPPRSAIAVGWRYADQSYPTLNGPTRNASIGILQHAVVLRSEFDISTDPAGNVLGAPDPTIIWWPRMPVGWALIDVNVTSAPLETKSDTFVFSSISGRARLGSTVYDDVEGWWYAERVWDVTSITGGASFVRDIDYVIEAQVDGDYIRFTPQAGRPTVPTSTPVTVTWRVPGATTVEVFVSGARYARDLPHGFRVGSITQTAIGWNQIGTWLFTGFANDTRTYEDHLLDVAACGL